MPRPAYLRLPEIAVLLLLVFLLLISMSTLAGGTGLGGIVLLQVVVFGGPPVVIAHHITGTASGTAAMLGLRRPSVRAMIGATLAGVSVWYVTLSFIMPISVRLFGTEDLAELQETFVGADLPMLVIVLAVGLAPAVCEELLYRGALARSLERRMGAFAAIVISALLFGVTHMQPVRMLPATGLGLVLGIATLRTGSVIPSMWVHLLNNSIALLLAGGVLPQLTGLIETHPVGLAGGATALCVIGLWLLWTSAPQPHAQAKKPGSQTSP